MCVDIAREAKKLVAQGKDLVEVRRVVEEKYGSRGPATDTPMPPL